MTEPTELPADVIAAIREGKRIEAIKRLRAARGLQLKDAKDQVEAYAGAHQIVLPKFEGAGIAATLGFFLRLLQIVLLIAFFVILFTPGCRFAQAGAHLDQWLGRAP